MAKGVERPANLWSDAKLALEPLMTNLHIQNDVLIIWACFIIRCPATLSDFKLTIFYQFLHPLLLFGRLSSIPHVEEFHLNVGKGSIGIPFELFKSGIEDKLNIHSAKVSQLLTAIKVLLVSFLPAKIIVGMWDDMHSDGNVLRLSLLC